MKYRVTLTGEERDVLQRLVQKGNTAGHRIRRAQMLLALDGMPSNERRTGEKAGAACGVKQRAAGVLRKRFAEEGFGAALERKKRETPPRVKTGGEAEAEITALACSEPPEGGNRWALRLPAGKAAGMGILDSISGRGIGAC
jgi:hypothetical protein